MVRILLNQDTCLGTVRVARDPWLRFRGLMSRTEVPTAFGSGLLFPTCRSLHTLFMQFSLDVLFLDAEGRVEKCCLAVPPWKSVTGPRSSKHALEVTSGLLTDIKVGDVVTFEPLGNAQED